MKSGRWRDIRGCSENGVKITRRGREETIPCSNRHLLSLNMRSQVYIRITPLSHSTEAALMSIPGAHLISLLRELALNTTYQTLFPSFVSKASRTSPATSSRRSAVAVFASRARVCTCPSKYSLLHRSARSTPPISTPEIVVRRSAVQGNRSVSPYLMSFET